MDSIENLGSREGEANNSIQALRDPFLFEDENETLHIYWAAKSFNKEGDVISSIVHAVIHDFESPNSIEILRPLRPSV